MTSAKNGISEALVKKADVVAWDFAPRQPKADDEVAVNEEFKDFVDAATLAYELGLEWAKEEFLAFAERWKWAIFRNQHFRLLAYDHAPKYYRVLAINFAEAATDPSWSADVGTLKCQRCDNPLEDQGTENSQYKRYSYLTASESFQCEACLAIESNE